MTYLQVWMLVCVIMAIRETSDDVYDPDYQHFHVVRLFAVNLIAWHWWFIVDCLSLVNRPKDDQI